MATAITVPPIIERTGTADRPRPDSRAKCTPTTPATGIPALWRQSAAPDRRDADSPDWSALLVTLRTLNAVVMAARPTTSTATPIPITVQSTLKPASGYTGRTGPSGPSGERATATTAATIVPSPTASSTPTRPS